MSEAAFTIHPLEPVFSPESEILILGSFPSVKSRETAFYYGHPQNRFWRVLAALTDKPVPASVDEKRAFLLGCGIALYDAIYECDIAGSSDSSIRNIVPTDLSPVLHTANIAAVFTNGGTAARVYKKYHLPITGLEAVSLPSTSPANAAWSLDRLISAWTEEIAPYI